jgi:hypothetical protein
MKKSNIINEAIKLRKEGLSFREIAYKLNIAKSTTSLWLRDIKLSNEAKKRIIKLGVNGRKKGIETNRHKRKVENDLIRKKVATYFSSSKKIKIDFKVACALLYWCEGTKCKGNKSISFANADPKMIKYFLHTFRKSFAVDEKKLRALIHLHEYHDIKKQLIFWSKLTKIPISQFNKSYIKENTGKNKKENYPGCVNIKYSDVKIYKEIMFVIEELIKV